MNDNEIGPTCRKSNAHDIIAFFDILLLFDAHTYKTFDVLIIMIHQTIYGMK